MFFSRKKYGRNLEKGLVSNVLMLKETRQNVSAKESLLFCALGGGFVYFVTALPRILFYLFPPEQPKGLTIQYYVLPPPDKIPFLVSFILFTLLGIYCLQKMNFKNRLLHFSLLGLVSAMGGGFLTSCLETFYYVFLIGDLDDQAGFIAKFKENWVDSLLYDVRAISWIIVFLLILTPFITIFLTSKILFKKITSRNTLK